MRQWRWGTGIAIVAIALHTWACATEIAPQIETERRFTGTVQPPPPSPPVVFDMSLFLRKLAAGQHGVSGGFTAGPVAGSVVGTLTGEFDDGVFAGRLIAPESRSGIAGPGSGRGPGVLALVVVPSMALMAARQGTTGCVVEQEYTGTVTTSGIVWTPREVVRSCPTNPLNFAIQAAPVVQPVTTSVSTTSTVPTTSISTTTSTTTTSVPTTTTSVATTSTSTSTTSTTSTSTTTSSAPSTTTTSIGGARRP
jgi:hypothetical protein